MNIDYNKFTDYELILILASQCYQLVKFKAHISYFFATNQLCYAFFILNLSNDKNRAQIIYALMVMYFTHLLRFNKFF